MIDPPFDSRPLDQDQQEYVRPEQLQQEPISPEQIHRQAPIWRSSLNLLPVQNKIRAVLDECKKVLVGQDELAELILICILSDGHILLEGVPGIAKTLAAKVISKTIDSDFSRIQFTPDLMPSDILGTSIFNMKTAEFAFNKGPIFSNVILIDEINRSPAKTQAALFEVMEEKQITFDGQTYIMSYPFVVIATQNPIEQEGTYRLPEAQLDRFLMKIKLGYPSREQEVKIMQRFMHEIGRLDLSIIDAQLDAHDMEKIQKLIKDIHVENQMLSYIADIIHETRNHAKIYLGGSPRASLAILRCSKVTAMIAGRDYVIPDDIQYVTPHILNHRLILSPDAEMEGLTPKIIINDIIESQEVPR